MRSWRFILPLTAGLWFLAQGPAAGQLLVSGSSQGQEEQAAETAEQAEIISLSGTVDVKRSGGSAFENATEGMLLNAGDTVRAGSGAHAELGFDEEDKNIVRVEENTTSVVMLQGDQKIQLLQGEVFSIVGNLEAGHSFEVVTPTAVAGARGTEWITRYDGQETEVEAYEDTPFVKTIDESGTAGQEIRVTPGYMRRVARFKPPTAMAQIAPARRDRWQNLRGDIRQRVQAVRERRGMPQRFARPGLKAALRDQQGPLKQAGPGLKKPDQASAAAGQESLRQKPDEAVKRAQPLQPAGKPAVQRRLRR